MKYLLSVLSLLVVAFPATVLFLRSPQPVAEPGREGLRRPSRAPVLRKPRIVPVRLVSLPPELTLSGELEPLRTFEVVSRLAGVVSGLRFKPGDRIGAGAVVAVIHAPDLNARAARHEADLHAAEKALQAREREATAAEKLSAERRDLARRELISRREVEDAEAAMETARASAKLARALVLQQQAMLAQARAMLDLARVKAPSAGEVLRRNTQNGTRISEGGAILTIGAVAQLKLSARVESAAALGLRAGTPARVFRPGQGEPVSTGEVTRLIAFGDEATEVEIVLDNHGGLFRAGTTVEARMGLEASQSVLLVPRSAVIQEGGSRYVLTYESGRSARRQIHASAIRGNDIVVAQGLTDRDFVIADALAWLASDRAPRPAASRLE